jgi:transposase
MACARASVLIRLLPPYSPDFNPIEYSFHNLKAWFRRNWMHAHEYTRFGQFLQKAICTNQGMTKIYGIGVSTTRKPWMAIQ